jgi:hypothetical protein
MQFGFVLKFLEFLCIKIEWFSLHLKMELVNPLDDLLALPLRGKNYAMTCSSFCPFIFLEHLNEYKYLNCKWNILQVYIYNSLFNVD